VSLRTITPSWYEAPAQKGQGKRIAIRDVIDNASIISGIAKTDILGKKRTREYARVRQAISYVLHRRRPDLSYCQIGRQLGQRDHSTIIHSVREARKHRLKDPEFDTLIQKLEAL